jgi:UDP:flavonoid glycosyltransferase YjiC (YdhE family)
MTKYLFSLLTSNDLGLLARSLPVARELAGRGHQVFFCNPASAPRTLIAQAGFENLPLRHPYYFLLDLQAHGALNPAGMIRAYRDGAFQRDFGGLGGFARQLWRAIPTRFAFPTAQMWNGEQMLAMAGLLNEGFVRAELQAILEIVAQVDLVVDAWNPFACAAARILKKPLATIIQVDMHPHSRGFIWWKETPPGLPRVTPVFNKILAEYGLPSLEKVDELFIGELTLAVGMPETDPLPTSAQAQVTYVGAILWQAAHTPMPGWFAELRPDQPVIWLYPGNPRYMPIPSPVDGEGIIRDCLRALSGEPVQVILSTGNHPLPKKFLPLPPNFRYVPYLPGLAMAERSDLLIHHGGYGSCQTGLLTGTPAVIIPTFSERESNARRVAAVGAAEVLPPGGNPFGALWGKWGVDPDLLRATVWKVLDDPSYRASAQRLSEKLRAYGGARAAADLIEGLPIKNQHN